MSFTRPNPIPADWLVPEWPAPAGVHAVFTTRAGGVSQAPFDSMNLGSHVGDQPTHVESNRQLLGQALHARPVFLNQVHGAEVLTLQANTSDGVSADACVTREPALACTVMVADCLAVLLTHEDGTTLAAAHAGWRGLAGLGGRAEVGAGQGGVIEAVFKRFSALAHIEPAQIAPKTIAWMSPCIGPTAFQVGPEVKVAFEASTAGASAMFEPSGGGKYLADLAGLARLRLQALGITRIYGNDGSAAWCTVRNSSRFFSHRRDTGVGGLGSTGRMAACIWRNGG